MDGRLATFLAVSIAHRDRIGCGGGRIGTSGIEVFVEVLLAWEAFLNTTFQQSSTHQYNVRNLEVNEESYCGLHR